jgi:hypothetical protein
MIDLNAARSELHAWLDDLSALRALVDPNDPDRAELNAAWNAAYAKAREAARAYAEAVKAART